MPNSMGASATALLPLHPGKAPRWLFSRMVELARCITEIVIGEYGREGLMNRLSDPWFFQSLSCVLGYDWHSSGTTTVNCGALKEAIDPVKTGLAIAGGKGKTSMKAPTEIREMGETFSLSGESIENLVYSSRMAAKVDNSLVQDGYQLYHHCFFFDERGKWIVIQQGINQKRANARRYHWPIDHRNFVEEPQSSIRCDTRLPHVLNMTSIRSDQNRRACVDLARENPERLRRILLAPVPPKQSRLDSWTGVRVREQLVMPRSVNWDTLREVYEFQPSGYEELVAFKGVGPSTVRGLSLIAELVYGERASWDDPVRFNFAFGGKDGVPFPVNRRAMDEAVDILKSGISSSNVRDEEKIRAFRRLRTCVPPIPEFRL
ncbi:MAG: DUF763 domain-containing protein [Candidatus Bathyarchaeota archaeon]|nr:DUF763 domain-containing protein [Candidatus Bathyarchaeota archaeon]